MLQGRVTDGMVERVRGAIFNRVFREAKAAIGINKCQNKYFFNVRNSLIIDL